MTAPEPRRPTDRDMFDVFGASLRVGVRGDETMGAYSAPLRLLFIHAPALDTFFLELADLARFGPLDPPRLRLHMERWGSR